MEGSIRGDATPQIGTRAIFLFSKEEPVFRDFFQRDGIAGSAVHPSGAWCPGSVSAPWDHKN
jgi:hypothetical protein